MTYLVMEYHTKYCLSSVLDSSLLVYSNHTRMMYLCIEKKTFLGKKKINNIDFAILYQVK